MKITKLISTEFISIIKENKDLIKSFVKSLKEGKAKSEAQWYSYKEDKLIHLIGYLYERTNNLYKSKKNYKGIAETTLTEIIGFAHPLQTKLYLNILIELGLITKSGKPKAGVASYDYTVRPIDLMNINGYGNKSAFTKCVFDKKKVKKAFTGNLLLNKAIEERVELDTTSKKYITLKNKLLANDKQNENHINYVENYFKHKVYGFQVADVNDRRMSLFTSCKKEFRELLTIDGEGVMTLDFANSQPAFLANYIEHKYNQHNIEMTDDIKLFVKLCSQGLIYEYIGDILFNGDRNKAKDLWMSAGYGHMSLRTLGDEVMQSNKNGLLFAELFPNVIKFLDNKKERESYNKVATNLQKYEAKFVNAVSDLLFEQGIINITVYDEFIVKCSEFEIAKSIIEEQLKLNGLKIILKVDKNACGCVEEVSNTITHEDKKNALEVLIQERKENNFWIEEYNPIDRNTLENLIKRKTKIK